jgi:penicillin-binding protein 1A
MTIGGLTVGVTPMDMAHAYETIAHGGQRISGTLGAAGEPVGIQEVEAGGRPLPNGARRDVNHVRAQRVLPASVAATETSMLETVLQYGTGRAAALGQFAAGKTGTTSNYGDAWFVGWNSKYTVAVWVGYPTKLVPMTTEFNGNPVLGGTFPALIWHDFLTSAVQIDKTRGERAAAKKGASGEGGEEGTSTGPEGGGSSAPAGGSGKGATPSSGAKGKSTTPSAPAGEGGEGKGTEAAPSPSAPPAASQGPATPPASPAPTPAPPPSSSPSGTGGVGPGG